MLKLPDAGLSFRKGAKQRSNQEVRDYFYNKKFKIKFYATIIATIIIVIGCELSSPHFSITGVVTGNIVGTSPTLKAVLGKGIIQKFLGYIYTDPNDLTHIIKNSGKSAIIVVILLLVGIHFFTMDPLSNSELLRNLYRKDVNVKPPFLLRLLRELKFYANNLPSNRLPEICYSCVSIGCPNRLDPTGDKKNFRWASILAYLPVAQAQNLLSATHKCREIVYLRYLLFFSGTSLIGFYFIARFIEYFYKINSYRNLELIIYISFLFVTAMIIGAFNFSTLENARGVWGNFKEIINQTLDSEDFMVVFIEKVCKHKNGHSIYSIKESNVELKKSVNSKELHELVTLAEFLDQVVINKLINTLNLDNSSVIPDKAWVRNLLSALTQMYKVNNDDEYCFRAAIFTPSECSNYLKPFVAVSDTSFLTFENELNVKLKLSRDGGSVAAKAWGTHVVYCASGEDVYYFHEQQKDYIKSIIAYPLVLDKSVVEAFARKEIPIEPLQGVLCIDSNLESVFASQRQNINQIIIKPFATRILFEITYNYIKSTRSN
jgi:hypothetical protein